MARWTIQGARPLRGEAKVPPDKSILHRALLLSGLGQGPCTVGPLGAGEDNRSTLSALQSLGVRTELRDNEVEVQGCGGPANLKRPPDGTIDCGNSGTTMRLLAGIVAAADGLEVILDGDASLRSRPMKRLTPLIKMGAMLEPVRPSERWQPPLRVRGAPLSGCSHQLSIASAQVKTAILLAGLFAEGRTRVQEPARSRDHTERMLRALGVELIEDSEGGLSIEGVGPSQAPWQNPAFHRVPPDLSSATFLLVAGALTGGEVSVTTGFNPTRKGAYEVLRNMGLGCSVVDQVERSGEPVATLRTEGGKLSGTTVQGSQTLRAIDELPVLAGAALFADGVTHIRDAAELRAKESDRIEETARVLRAFGGQVETHPDGLSIRGGAPLQGAHVEAGLDHRVAMTAAVVGLAVPGTTVVQGAEVASVSFPNFVEVLRELGAGIEVSS